MHTCPEALTFERRITCISESHEFQQRFTGLTGLDHTGIGYIVVCRGYHISDLLIVLIQIAILNYYLRSRCFDDWERERECNVVPVLSRMYYCVGEGAWLWLWPLCKLKLDQRAKWDKVLWSLLTPVIRKPWFSCVWSWTGVAWRSIQWYT